MTPQHAADIAAAAYSSGLPDLLDEVYGGSDYAQIRGDADGLHISFCGSDDPMDWQSNRNAELADWLVGKVHEGFLLGWHEIRVPIRRALANLPQMPLHLYGHSRGGALAMLASIDLLRPPATITTFGCPRAGNWTFCRAVEATGAKITRYETRTLPVAGFRDAVPHLPPEAVGYDHPGEAIYLFAVGRPSAQHSIKAYRQALKK